MKEKILNIILARRAEVENKWWHRLFTVLLFGSGIVVFMLAVFLTVNSYHHNWVTYPPVAFSLESNYQEVSGKELPCELSIDTSDNEHLSFIIQCKGVDISMADSKRYEALYETARNNLEKQFGLDKYFTTPCPTSTPGTRLSAEQIACIRKAMEGEQSDPAYANYQDSLKNIARIKVVRDVNFRIMFSDILLWLIIPIFSLVLWIVFWSSIIYRLILYIIFGKKK